MDKYKEPGTYSKTKGYTELEPTMDAIINDNAPISSKDFVWSIKKFANNFSLVGHNHNVLYPKLNNFNLLKKDVGLIGEDIINLTKLVNEQIDSMVLLDREKIDDIQFSNNKLKIIANGLILKEVPINIDINIDNIAKIIIDDEASTSSVNKTWSIFKMVSSFAPIVHEHTQYVTYEYLETIKPSLKGERGEQGIQGETGRTGKNGEKGERGIAGINGRSMILRGHLNSPSELPKLNNLISDTFIVGTNIYTFNGAIWVDGGNIQGPVGRNGIDGKNGINGKNGIDGRDGIPEDDFGFVCNVPLRKKDLKSWALLSEDGNPKVPELIEFLDPDISTYFCEKYNFYNNRFVLKNTNISTEIPMMNVYTVVNNEWVLSRTVSTFQSYVFIRCIASNVNIKLKGLNEIVIKSKAYPGEEPPKYLFQKRGYAVDLSNYLGKEGEILVDVERKSARIYDGEQVGGYELAKRRDVGNINDTTLAPVLKGKSLIGMIKYLFENGGAGGGDTGGGGSGGNGDFIKDWGTIGTPESITVQIKRGTTSQITSVILPQAELVYNLTRKTLCIGDDVTPGGTTLATTANVEDVSNQLTETERKLEETNLTINKVSGDLTNAKIELNGTITATKDEIIKKMASIETTVDGIKATVGSQSNALTELDAKLNLTKESLLTDIDNAKETAISESHKFTASYTEKRVTEVMAQIKITTDSITQKVQGNETLIQDTKLNVESTKQELTTKIGEAKEAGILESKTYTNAEIQKSNQQTSEKLAQITTTLDDIKLEVASTVNSLEETKINVTQTKEDLLIDIDNAKTSTLKESKQFTQTHTEQKVREAVAAIKITTDSITQRVQGAETSITETNTNLNHAKEQIDSRLVDLDNKVSNITIGGGNLISNKKYNILGFEPNIVSGTMDNLLIKDSRIGVIETEPIPIGNSGIKKGVEYTLSFTQFLEISEQSTAKGTYMVFYKEGTTDPILVVGGETTIGNKEYVVKTFTVPVEITHVAIRLLSSKTSTTLLRTKGSIEGLKLEEGNQATSWSPAPEDVVSDIENAKKEAITASKEYTNIEITKTVKSTEKKFAEIQTTLDSINLTVSANTEAIASTDTKIDHAKAQLNKDILNAKNQAINISQTFTEEKVREAKAAIEITTNSISQKVAANESSLVTTNTKIDSAKEELQGNIDNGILTTKEYAKVEVDKVISSTNQKFGEITTQLGQIDLAVGNANKTIATVNSKVDINKEELDGKIAGIEIGVVNKVKNSDFSLNKNGWNIFNTQILNDNGIKYVSLGYEWLLMQNIKLEANKEYTFSALIRYSKSNVNFNKARISLRINGDVPASEVNGLISLVDLPQNEWIRLHVTFTARKTGIHEVYFLKEQNNADNKLDFAQLKLEFGNKPTSWSPHPYDTETGIENAKNEAITISENFTQTKIEEATASIKVTTDGISQKVSATENSITETNTKIDIAKEELQTSIGNAQQEAIDSANNNTTIEINKVTTANNSKFASIDATLDGINTDVVRLTDETTTINGEVANVKKAVESVSQKVTPEGIYTEIKKNGQFNNEVINEIASIRSTSNSLTSQINKLESITGEECIENGNFKADTNKWYKSGGITYQISSTNNKKWLNVVGLGDNKDKYVYQDCFIKQGISYNFSALIYGSGKYYKIILEGRNSSTGVYEIFKTFGTITNSFDSTKPQSLEQKDIINTKYDLIRVKITAPLEHNFNYFITDISFLEKGKLASQTEIKMLQDKISQKVDVNGVTSVIEQNPNSVQIGFNKINNAFEVNPSGVFLKDSRGNKHLDFTQGAMHTYSPETGNKIGKMGMAEWTMANKPSLKYGLAIVQNKNSWFGISEFDDTNGTTRPSMAFNFTSVGDMRGIYVYDHMVFKPGCGIYEANISWSEGLRESAGIYLSKNDNQGSSSTIRIECASSSKDAVEIGYQSYNAETIARFTPRIINFYNSLNMNNNSITNSRMLQAETFESSTYNTRKRTLIKTTLTKAITPNTEFIGEGVVKNNICEIILPEDVIGLSDKYMVILTPIGNNKIYLEEKLADKFVVKGDNCKFDYCLKIITTK